MKRLSLLSLLLSLLIGSVNTAFPMCPSAPLAQRADSIVYRDASSLPLYGKAYADDGPRYRRLPASLQPSLRAELWRLGCNSAGLYLRFRTDAPEIHARWTNTAYHMPHMTDCAVGGLDLYAYIDGKWRFVGAAFDSPKDTPTQHHRKLVANMQPQMREYMLYLSLYDEVKSLELGVPEGYTIHQPELASPRSQSPIVMYGTSILQGACASRPGMAHTNILARQLDRTVINLGFSGNAHLDTAIALLMASVVQPAVFVLDYVPNCKPELIRQNGEAFFRILRRAHPTTPVLFVEDPQFPHGVVNQSVSRDIHDRNAAQRMLYQSLVDAGERNVFYVSSDGMTGPEDFVDGIHFTDQGMRHYANHLAPILAKAIATQTE